MPLGRLQVHWACFAGHQRLLARVVGRSPTVANTVALAIQAHPLCGGSDPGDGGDNIWIWFIWRQLHNRPIFHISGDGAQINVGGSVIGICRRQLQEVMLVKLKQFLLGKIHDVLIVRACCRKAGCVAQGLVALTADGCIDKRAPCKIVATMLRTLGVPGGVATRKSRCPRRRLPRQFCERVVVPQTLREPLLAVEGAAAAEGSAAGNPHGFFWPSAQKMPKSARCVTLRQDNGPSTSKGTS